MSEYPEWFVGGPLHGQDKRNTHPDTRGTVRVRVPVFPDVLLQYSRLSDLSPVTQFEEFVYVPKRVEIFGACLIAWVSEYDATETYRGFEAPAWIHALREMIMFPHVTDPARTTIRATSDEYGRRVTERMQIDRYREEIHHLRGLLRRRESSTDTPTQWIDRQTTDTGVLQIKIGDGVLSETLTNITLYEDAGDEENLPGWIATTQAADKNTGEEIGFTGYGPDPTSAVMALLADKLNYYGRFVPYGDKGRIR